MHPDFHTRTRFGTRRHVALAALCFGFLTACAVVPSIMFAQGDSVGGIVFPTLGTATVEQLAASVTARMPTPMTPGRVGVDASVGQVVGQFMVTAPVFGSGDNSSSSALTYSPQRGDERPAAVAHATTTYEDTSVLVTLRYRSSALGGVATFATTTNPLHGVLGPIVGDTVRYTPNANWYGRDSFGFVVRDGAGTSTCAASVRITVTPVNDAPEIALNGDNPTYLTVGDTFVDSGAIVRDVEDGTKIVYGKGTVNTGTTSITTLHYRYVDRGGAIATTTRTVLVSAVRTFASETHITNALWLRGSTSWAGWEFPVNWSVTGSSTAAPTGSVTIWVNGAVACVSGLMTGTCFASSTTVGTSTVQASYSGDATYRASVSVPVPHRIIPVAADVCLNLDGIQASLPDGYHYEEGMCVPNGTPSGGGGSCINCGEGGGAVAVSAPVRTGGGIDSERTPKMLRITNERGTTSEAGTAAAAWDTNERATGRVVCGPVSGAPYSLDRSAPNFGYPFGSPEVSDLTIDHTVPLEGLLPGTYRCRVASRTATDAPWTVSDEFTLVHGATIVAMGGGSEAGVGQVVSPEVSTPTGTEVPGTNVSTASNEPSMPGQLAAALAALGGVFSWGTCSGAWLPWIVVLCALVYATLWPRTLLTGTSTLVGGMQRLSVLAALGIAGTLLALALDKNAWVIPLTVGTVALMAAFGMDLYAQGATVPERFARVLWAFVGVLACALVTAVVAGWTCIVLPLMVLIAIMGVRYALRRANA